MSIVFVYCCAIRVLVAIAFCSRSSTSRYIRFIAFQYGIWISSSPSFFGKRNIRYSRQIPEFISKSLTKKKIHFNDLGDVFPSSGFPSLEGTVFHADFTCA